MDQQRDLGDSVSAITLLVDRFMHEAIQNVANDTIYDLAKYVAWGLLTHPNAKGHLRALLCDPESVS